MASLKYKTQLMKYTDASSHYVEVFINVKRIVKIESITEEEAIERALSKEERKLWKKMGYEFVDCDYNVSNKLKFDAFRLRTRERK